jgi:hypothetical protein
MIGAVFSFFHPSFASHEAHSAKVASPLPSAIVSQALQPLVRKEDIQEFITLKIHEFLLPYFRKEITPKNENINRPSLPSQILPQLKDQVTKNPLTENKAVCYMLSSYLEQCANACLPPIPFQPGGINFPSKTPREELQKQVAECLPPFTEALKHSLKIDFKELNLTYKEIESLAAWGLHHTPIFDDRRALPENWRELQI